MTIGDFGLSLTTDEDRKDLTMDLDTSKDSDPNSPADRSLTDRGRSVAEGVHPGYTTGVGTAMYAAPEQLEGTHHAPADIFSLGVIFFELFCSIGTAMERDVLLSGVREGMVPPAMEASWQQEMTLVKRMVSRDPAHRYIILYIIYTLPTGILYYIVLYYIYPAHRPPIKAVKLWVAELVKAADPNQGSDIEPWALHGSTSDPYGTPVQSKISDSSPVFADATASGHHDRDLTATVTATATSTPPGLS